MELCVLASGSSGNAVFVKDQGVGVLVDAGISYKQICLRLQQHGHSIEDVHAVLVTHEHSDHIRGLRVLQKNNPIPAFMTKKTKRRAEQHLYQDANIKFVKPNSTFFFRDLLIHPLSTVHDASDPVCYFIGDLGVVTDTGVVTPEIRNKIKQSVNLVLETNHDEEMLETGPYPYYLKQRIFSSVGHLSNTQAAEVVQEVGQHLQQVFLAHRSVMNNTPALARIAIKKVVRNGMQLNQTFREKPTAMFSL